MRWWTFQYSGMWHNVECCLHFEGCPRTWCQKAPPNAWNLCTSLHGSGFQNTRIFIPPHHGTFGVDIVGCHLHYNSGHANATQCYVVHALPVLLLSVLLSCAHFFSRTPVGHAVGFCFEDFVIRNGSPGSALLGVDGWGLQMYPV